MEHRVSLKTNKKLNKNRDFSSLLIITIILIIFGAIMVYSSSTPEAVLKFQDGNFYLKRHIRSIAIGFVMLFIGSMINYKLYEKFAIPIIIFSVFLNLLLYTRFGENNLGQTRWLDLPFLPSFMPSDVLKLGGVMFFAYYLKRIGKNIRKPRGMIFSLLFAGIFVFLIFLKDMGSSIVLLFSLASMAVVAGFNLAVALILLIILAVAGYFVLKLDFFKYRARRLTSFLDPFSDMKGDGRQLSNSILSVALGGLTGVGIGKGIQKHAYIPHVYNDFIFSVVGEELGFVGALFLILLFVLFGYVSLGIAFKSKDTYAKLLAVGITTTIMVQAILHIFVNIGLAPVTGITLPFISYGGTSLIINMFSTGILLNISKNKE